MKLCQAIIHLRNDADLRRTAIDRLRPALAILPGVSHISVKPADDTLAVDFDHDRMGLGDLIRIIEDCGTPVARVAQRAMA